MRTQGRMTSRAASLLCAASLLSACASTSPADSVLQASTHHPDPCGVDNKLDGVVRDDHAWESPAVRVQAAAKKLYRGRFLEVFIANVRQQYGVGVVVYRLTAADEKAFFKATCFRRGDVVFEDGPVSRAQLKAWRAKAVDIVLGSDGGCLVGANWRTGQIEVGVQPGHPELRAKLERVIPTEHLKIEEGLCPQA